MTKKSTSIKLIVSSIFILFSAALNGLWSFVAVIIEAVKKIYNLATDENTLWSLLSHALKVGNNALKAVETGFNYTDINSWVKLLGLSTAMGTVHNKLTVTTAILQALCGIVGIIYACIVLSKRDIKWNSIPMVLGALGSTAGLLALITLFTANIVSFGFVHLVLIFTFLIMSMIYTVAAYKFKKTAEGLPIKEV